MVNFLGLHLRDDYVLVMMVSRSTDYTINNTTRHTLNLVQLTYVLLVSVSLTSYRAHRKNPPIHTKYTSEITQCSQKTYYSWRNKSSEVRGLYDLRELPISLRTRHCTMYSVYCILSTFNNIQIKQCTVHHTKFRNILQYSQFHSFFF